MTSVWHKTRSRIAEATWDELQTRLGQAVAKRLDLAKYRIGLPVNVDGFAPPISDYHGFFFSSDELPGRVRFLKDNCAEAAATIVGEADSICQHRFRLLGYEDLDYGKVIDWHLDALHFKKEPLKPWYKIPFLRFEAVGDHKIIWELNRHQHLVTLAKAWALTHKDEYAVELIQQWYTWQRANPFPLGINWSSSLEVAFRSLSWLWVRHLLAQYPAPNVLWQDVLQALEQNGRYIQRFLSTYFSPNTHLIGEALALFATGTLCPQISAARRWQSLGWGILLREAKRQVRSDGVYFEQSLYYHVYALDFFLHARILATRNGVEVPAGFDATLIGMLEVLRALSQGGPPDSFGDDDGGRVFNPRRNRSEHLADPLAIGGLLFGRDDFVSATQLTEEAVWLFPPEKIAQLGCKPRSGKLKSTAFKASGIYITACSEPCAQRMVIDAGAMGAGRAGHSHADALNLTVSFGGRHWLIDPGTFCYTGIGLERDRFRGTAAHSTLRVDGVDQAVPDGLFAWSLLPEVEANRWIEGSIFSLFAGSHSGYLRLRDPVLHRRFVFHLFGGFWLVRDCVSGAERHHLETFWHFAPDLTVRNLGNSFVSSPSELEATAGLRLALVPLQSGDWKSDLGWDEVSPAYGKKELAPLCRMSAEVPLPAECAMVVAPLFNESDRTGTLRELCHRTGETGGAQGYRYDDSQGTHSMMFSDGGRKWSLGPWMSDAEFVYCSVREGKLRKLILCNGSFLTANQVAIFARSTGIARVEWSAAGRDCTSYSSNEAKGDAMVLQSCDLSFDIQ